MDQKILLAMCSYVDGKHQSQIQFQLDFPEFINQTARERNLPLECSLLKLVGCDEMARKHDIHTTMQSLEIDRLIQYDAIFDRVGTMSPTAGIFLDRALYSGAQIFNRPLSIDESKARDYMLATIHGFAVPKTVVLVQGCYVRAQILPGQEAMTLDIDLDEAVRRVGGYPCFLKKANGGGRAHVYRVKNKAELFELFQITREFLMVLQGAVDFDKYIRTFCFGERVIHTVYDLEKPDGQKYSWPEYLTDEERFSLDHLMPSLAQLLLTPFCTMEIAHSKTDGKWYFIDITNGCNFDMREGELSTPIFQVARQMLMEQLLEWSLRPRPMIVHSHLQEYVFHQQWCRAQLKGQNPELLLQFAQQQGFDLHSRELAERQKQFAEEYAKL